MKKIRILSIEKTSTPNYECFFFFFFFFTQVRLYLLSVANKVVGQAGPTHEDPDQTAEGERGSGLLLQPRVGLSLDERQAAHGLPRRRGQGGVQLRHQGPGLEGLPGERDPRGEDVFFGPKSRDDPRLCPKNGKVL